MLTNPYRQQQIHFCPSAPFPSVDADTPLALLARCPQYHKTPLRQIEVEGMSMFVKDERERMGLGSFKALGAAYVIATWAQQRDLRGEVFITPSAGNHGLSVAAGARVFGARSVVVLSATVPESFAQRLSKEGAEVWRAGNNYEESMEAAAKAAAAEGWTLLSDTSWEGYTELPHLLMEGYLVLAAEAVQQMEAAADVIFLQAGVGGLAVACAAYFRHAWGEAPKIYVVEPTAAPALHDSIKAGSLVTATGPVSNMGRLDCKEPSQIALNGLARQADGFILLDDDEVEQMLPTLEKLDCATTPSGGAGMVAALRHKVPLTPETRVLCIISEAAV